MIGSFRHKGLRELFKTGRSRRVTANQQPRIIRVLDILDNAARPEDMNLPGFRFHKLMGKPTRFSVRITGNWRLTFGWQDDCAIDVDLEDYH